MFESDKELEDSLVNLARNTRSLEQKEATLKKLEQSIRYKSRKRAIPLILGFTTVLTFGLFFMLWFIPSTTQPNTTANPYASLISDQAITRTYISKSTGPLSFKPKEYPLLPGVALIEQDTKWNKTLKSVLTELKESDKNPSDNPNFDLLVVLENNQTVKFKIWVDGETLVMNEFSSKDYYYLPAEEIRYQFETVLRTLTTKP